MGNGITVTADVYSKNLNKQLDALAHLQLKQALGQAAAVVEAAAKENLISAGHVKTGDLARSISYRVNDNTAEVYSNMPYATYVEFGTGSYAENGDGRPGWWVYVDEECNAPKSQQRIIYTKQQAAYVAASLAKLYGAEHVHMTNGQRPTRFLRNALRYNEQLIDTIIDSVTKELEDKA